MPLFLAELARDPDLERACRSSGTTPEQVEALRAYSGYFNAAFRIILREHHRRLKEAGLPVPRPPAAPDYRKAPEAERALRAGLLPGVASSADLSHFAANAHATAAVFRAENSALLRLLSIVAQAVGVEDMEGVGIYEWFNRERRVQLDHLLLHIGDTDPGHAEYLQGIFAVCREQCAPGSIAHPPEED